MTGSRYQLFSVKKVVIYFRILAKPNFKKLNAGVHIKSLACYLPSLRKQ